MFPAQRVEHADEEGYKVVHTAFKPSIVPYVGPYVGTLLLAILFLWHGAASGRSFSTVPINDQSCDLSNFWAMYSPYHPAGDYVLAPEGCQVIQANILQRHGARYPTTGASEGIAKALAKLKSVTNYTDSRLDFLKTYQYTLGVNDLVPLGAQESQEAGRSHFHRYRHLASPEQIPFVRASSSKRVVASATNWTEGFAVASNHIYRPKVDLILPENLNNTLDDKMCPNAGDSDSEKKEWLSVYGPSITSRLNQQAPGANLNSPDTYNLMSLCAFESVSTQLLSPFCGLYTDSDFEQYEYSGDLDKYYNTGYGQALGPVQGVGYINELLARLTGTPVRDNTQTNRTLDASPDTFPLNRTIYVDFSHDNQMIAIYAAMGLFRQPVPLDPLQPDPARSWVVSRMVPFSGRMVTEKLLCGRKEYVRVFVDDALQQLEFCGVWNDGLCSLKEFVDSQNYARNDGYGDFEKCFERS